jgi:hypothetical protein
MQISYKKTNPISIEDVKNVNKFKHISDEEATAILRTIKALSEIIYQYQKEKNKQFIEPQYLQAA